EFSPNKKFLVAAYENNSLCVWDIETKIRDIHLNTLLIFSKFLKDSKRFIVATFDKIMLLDIESKDTVGIFEYKDIQTISYSNNLKIEASGYRYNLVLSDIDTELPTDTLTSNLSEIIHLKFSPNDNIIAVGHEDSSITLWDLNTKRPIDMIESYAGKQFNFC